MNNSKTEMTVTESQAIVFPSGIDAKLCAERLTRITGVQYRNTLVQINGISSHVVVSKFGKIVTPNEI